uniref:Endonuclease/exonuclease/phosphatase domain-containing protein n=1 Tax=Kalanchoe fedtschenkoi TaxID=63787 RepID=A0A7N0V8S5_KALFE
MNQIIIWNARGACNQGTSYHLKALTSKYKPWCLSILEPMACSVKLSQLARKLGFSSMFYDADLNNHIAIFWCSEVEGKITHVDDQVVTLEFITAGFSKSIFVSVVYAACSKHARRRIWDNLLDLNQNIKAPWIIGGDFNVISSWEEKRGGRFYDDGSMHDFNSFIIQSGLQDISARDGQFS